MKSGNSLRYFYEHDWSGIAGSVVFLDVDGTLVADACEVLSKEIEDSLISLRSQSRVVITSNGGNRKRNERIAQKYGLEISPAGMRKPDPSIVIPFIEQGSKVVVIGDKKLVDGVFARAVGAQFIQVQRIENGSERLLVKCSYVVDQIPYIDFSIAKIKLARPRQWVKNVLVFAPAFFAVTIVDIKTFVNLIATFGAFCLVASSVYAANDARDVVSDSRHPIKRARPVASGAISIKVAYILASIWFTLGIFVAWMFAPVAVPYLLLYVAANIVYTLYLKKVPVSELITVAIFYIVRILAGGAVAGVPVSDWLILCAFFLATFLVVAKRRAEAKREIGTRGVLSVYPSGFLDAAIVLTATASLVSYSLYSVLASGHTAMVYSNVFVVFAVLRYLFLAWDGHGAERPEKLLMRDVPIVLAAGAWFAFVATLYYAY